MIPAYFHDLNFDKVCGAQLGKGVSREVFEFIPAPSAFVVKRMHDGAYGLHISANRTEFDFWSAYADRVGQHLAPCVYISRDSRHLIMRRTTPVSQYNEITSAVGGDPYVVWKWMGDAHSGNFGWFGDRIVAHDYAWVKPHEVH